jgi:BirA family transcriptional regulator, biotin operon repressor / biotin---[acetyl-CoA-carboxylase] ligase
MDVNALRRALLHSPVNELRAFESIGSTNDEALHWIDAGATDFALVITDQQTNGRGRLNRQWITRPEASLAFSVILKPTARELAAPSSLYAPMCGLAVWQALHEALGLDPQIKWPNDILLERQKCCGILVEAAWSGTQLNGIVLGIGINITADALPADAVTRYPATWLEKHTFSPVDRFALLSEISGGLQYWRDRLGSSEFFTTWQDHLAFRGETVRIVENEKTSIIGTEEGIDPSGNLIVRDADGKKIIIEVGDVTLRPEDEK